MEKRRSEKKKLNNGIETRLICNSKNYTGIIENISEHGLLMIVTSTKK